MKKITVILLTLLITLTSIPSLYASGNTLDTLNIEVYIHEDGSATITETWKMEVVEGTENFRVLDRLGDAYIKDYSVSDENGPFTLVENWNINASRQQKANTFGMVQNGNVLELCYGVGEFGSRTYTMQYTIVNFVFQYADTQAINWRFVSNDMKPMPNNVNILIQSDIELNNNNADIYGFGFDGNINFTENGILVTNNSNRIGGNGYVNVFIGLHDNFYSNANKQYNNFTYEEKLDDVMTGSDYRNNSNSTLRSALLVSMFFIIAIGSLIITLIYNYRKKTYFPSSLTFIDKEKLLKKAQVDPFRDIPCKKDVFRFYYIVKLANLAEDDDIKAGLIAAILLNWMRNGELTFVKLEGKKLDRKKYQVDFSQDVTCENTLEEELLSFFRSAAGTNKILETKDFNRWCSKNYSQLDAWFSKVDMYGKKELIDDESLIVNNLETKFIAMKIPQHKEIYTTKFREELYHVAGFKNFLLEFSSIEQKQVQEVRLWEDYLIFASVLGLAEKVEKELGRLYPNFNQYSQLDYSYTSIGTRYFIYSGMRSSSRARNAAQMRSSGGGGGSSFGGGGGSFGGGGGGGSR